MKPKASFTVKELQNIQGPAYIYTKEILLP